MENVVRAADAADDADDAAAAHASTEHGAGSSWQSAIEKRETYQRVVAEAGLLGEIKSLLGLVHVEAPKDDPSFGIKVIVLTRENDFLKKNLLLRLLPQPRGVPLGA